MRKTDSIEQLIANASECLAKSGSDSPQLDAAVLLCYTIDKPRSYLFTWPEKHITDSQFDVFVELIARRKKGVPIAYITGIREFWSLPLCVAPATLIPRPDTERLVELALEKALLTSGDILDLGTGTGAIALALASELPDRKVFGVDVQLDAVELAISNRQRLSIHNCEFCQSSWFDSLEAGMKFAVIVSNPPYIDENDPHLVQGDVRFEPKTALVSAEHGLADIRHIAGKAHHYLRDDGWLLFEHGFDQGEAVRDILLEFGFCSVETIWDYAGLERVTMGMYRLCGRV